MSASESVSSKRRAFPSADRIGSSTSSPSANEPDELRDVDYPELAHSPAAMVLNRPLGDPEFFGDLLISQSGRDESQYVALARSQGREFHPYFASRLLGRPGPRAELF